MSFHVGEVFGDYQITAIVGAGSMGQVYQVEHRITRRKEAMKVLSVELANETQIHRFEREIAVQAHLDHPNIATAHNALRFEGRLILVMEFLDGHTLESLLKRGKLPIESGVNYIRQTLSALRYAHQQGVVHRDVSPANLFITSNGAVKLTDFGLSKSFGDSQLTNFGEIVGAMNYMAPEQARASSIPDRRSDLYSVGVILYEILTGRKAFGERRSLGALLSESEAPPLLPTEIDAGLSPEWNDIVSTAMDRNPARRFQSAGEFLRALDGVGKASLVSAAAASGPVGRPPLGKIVVAIATLALALLVAAGLAMGLFRGTPAPAATIRATPPPIVAPAPPVPSEVKVEPPEPAPIEPPAPAPAPAPPPPAHAQASVRPHKPAPVPVAESTASAPVEPQADPTDNSAVEPGPDDKPAQPAKKGFWRKMNPFKKRN